MFPTAGPRDSSPVPPLPPRLGPPLIDAHRLLVLFSGDESKSTEAARDNRHCTSNQRKSAQLPAQKQQTRNAIASPQTLRRGREAEGGSAEAGWGTDGRSCVRTLCDETHDNPNPNPPGSQA